MIDSVVYSEKENFLDGVLEDARSGISHPSKIELIETGVLNYVFRVTCPSGRYYVKQALKKPKQKNVNPLFKKLSINRLQYEAMAYQKAEPWLPEGVSFPQVVYYDESRRVIVTKDAAGSQGILLQHQLLKGEFNAKCVLRIANFLRALHENSTEKQYVFRKSIQKEYFAWDLMLRIRTSSIVCPENSYDIYDRLNDFVAEILRHHTKRVMLHTDCCPKNILVSPRYDVTVLDFEQVVLMGDPLMDLGFLLGHYLLFSILSGASADSLSCIRILINSYFEQDLIISDFQRLGVYAGSTLIYRVLGPAPQDYIAAQKAPGIVKLGCSLVRKEIFDIDQLLSMCIKLTSHY